MFFGGFDALSDKLINSENKRRHSIQLVWVECIGSVSIHRFFFMFSNTGCWSVQKHARQSEGFCSEPAGRQEEMRIKWKPFAGLGANFSFQTRIAVAMNFFFLHWHGKRLYKICISFLPNETCAHVSRWCVFIISITTYTVVYNPKYTKRLCKPGKYLQTPTDTVMCPCSSQYHNYKQ